MARDNTGSIRKNERKEKDTHADYKGQATVGGVDYWLSAWIKRSDDGTWLSIAFDAKDDKPAEKPAPKGKQDDDSDFPF